MGTVSWLTLAELIKKSNLKEIECRRLLKKFRELLAPRIFGDIVKYPAPVADLLSRFTSLRRQGWTIEDLEDLLVKNRQKIREDCMTNKFKLLAELQQECALFLEQLEIVSNYGSRMQMQGALRYIANFMASFDLLIRSMLNQEKELSELRAMGSLLKFPCESAEQ